MGRKIKVKSPNIPPSAIFAKWFMFGSVMLLSAGMILSLFIALPKTEDYFSQVEFNLNLKDNSYKSKSYKLELIPSPDQDKELTKEIQQTADILHRRLNDYGVEIVKIEEYTLEVDEATEGEEDATIDLPEENEATKGLRVTVETTRNLESVDQIVGNRNYFRIVTPKEGVDFFDPDDQVAQYLPENYEYTKFTRDRFRSVVIKELPTSTGETAYFSIFKPKILESNDFYALMDKYANQNIGLKIDDFVSPYPVPYEFNLEYQQSTNSTNGGQATAKPLFAPAVGTTPDQAKIADVLYNSGVIPVKYNVVDEEENELSINPTDDYLSMLVLLASLLGIVVYVGWRNFSDKVENVNFVLSVVFTYAVWITLLKVTMTPVDLTIIYFTGFLLIYLLKLFNYRKTSKYTIELILFILFGGLFLFGDGFTKLFASQILLASVIGLLITFIARYYTYNLRRILN